MVKTYKVHKEDGAWVLTVIHRDGASSQLYRDAMKGRVVTMARVLAGHSATVTVVDGRGIAVRKG